MNCACDEINNNKFNNLIKKELALSLDIDDIINESNCISFDLNLDDNLFDVTLNSNEILSNFTKSMGIYHLWIEYEYCVQHHENQYIMLCVYVGKGFFNNRIKSHIKNKWEKTEKLYVTFYQCENRIAKYLEQCFLDIYSFHLNKDENNGKDYLKTIWNEERYLFGTNFDDYVEIMEKKNPKLFGNIQD